MSKKDSYWFTHDCDAFSDPKCIALVARYDMAGYGRWWRLLEILRTCSSTGYKYNISNKFSYPTLSTALNMTVEECRQYVSDCIYEFDLLTTDEEFIWSKSLLQRMEKWDRKKATLSANGLKGALVKHGKIEKINQPELDLSPIPETKPERIAAEPTVEEDLDKALKKEYQSLEKTKRSIYDFLLEKKPGFIEPYIAMWNIWALERNKPKISAITDKRRTHFKARLKEKEFDFMAILIKAANSNMCIEGSWFNFDWFTKSKDNYIKLLEGNYDNKSTPAAQGQQPVNAQVEDIKKLKQQKEIHGIEK